MVRSTDPGAFFYGDTLKTKIGFFGLGREKIPFKQQLYEVY